MNKEFFEALDALEKEGISKDYLLEKVEAALQTAFKKEKGGQANVRVSIDCEKKNVRVFEQFTVVEEVVDPTSELTVAEAKAIPSCILSAASERDRACASVFATKNDTPAKSD